ncbi:MAG: hypothetical protein HUU32_18475 [Calditrichaceae bacterium]|nr:hypothetical protein [Calditrichia bacterium]NUQ43379.1 hypothetical protein [Calditrichaceae bacterium]
MGLLKKALGLVWLALLPSLLFAGIEDIEIDLEIINPGAQVFIVGDFRSNLATTNFFILHLANTGPDQVPMYLEAEIKYNGVQIARGNSNVINFPPGYPSLAYGNQQLMLGALLPWGETLTLDEFDVDLEAVENLENQILATGQLPAGTYEFLMRAVEEGSGVIKPDIIPDNHILIITNPTTLELLFPGRSVSENTIEEITTTFPYFQWQTDANPLAVNYNVFVYEKFPEDETVQDVLSHPALLQLENFPLNFFQYPLSSDPGALSGQVVGPMRLLEAGKIYYWLVQSVIPTGTGDLTITSEVFRFKISDLAGSGTYAAQILALLEQILGPNYWPVLQQLRDNGFEPNGTIFLQQSEIEVSDLLLILGKLNRGEMEVNDVDVY